MKATTAPGAVKRDCASCQYCDIFAGARNGFCRKRAPSMVEDSRIARWPMVDIDVGDWCGEYVGPMGALPKDHAPTMTPAQIMRELYTKAEDASLPREIDRKLFEFAGELVEATFLVLESTKIDVVVLELLDQYLAGLQAEAEDRS